MLPLAALDLLRSRLSNAYEVTPITYIASDLIAEGSVAERIKSLLSSDIKFIHRDLFEVATDLGVDCQVTESPCAKVIFFLKYTFFLKNTLYEIFKFYFFLILLSEKCFF